MSGRACKLDIFPWSDSDCDPDTDRENANPLQLGHCSSMRSAPETNMRELDLDIRVVDETLTASKILWHCIGVVNAVREEHGGRQLCVFKIGLTANPAQRKRSYLQQNFKGFVIIHRVTQETLLGMLEMLEAALIAEFYDNQRCCRNKQLGGESMRNKLFEPRFPPPYFAYCAATNAAQKEPILG